MTKVETKAFHLVSKATAPGREQAEIGGARRVGNYFGAAPAPRAIGESESACACMACPPQQSNRCVLSKIRDSGSDRNIAACSAQPVHRVRARRTIWHPKDWSDDIIVICQGWAVCSIILENGRRQILSLIMAGDVVPTASLFGDLPSRSVEAVTDVVYRKFKRSDVKAALFADPEALERVSKLWAEEREQSDQLLVSLGRRTAEERIAWCILSIAARLQARGALSDSQTFHMPLRRKHIADFTGLTPVHVSRVMIGLQRSGHIDVDGRSMTIIDMAGLREIAQWR